MSCTPACTPGTEQCQQTSIVVSSSAIVGNTSLNCATPGGCPGITFVDNTPTEDVNKSYTAHKCMPIPPACSGSGFAFPFDVEAGLSVPWRPGVRKIQASKSIPGVEGIVCNTFIKVSSVSTFPKTYTSSARTTSCTQRPLLGKIFLTAWPSSTTLTVSSSGSPIGAYRFGANTSSNPSLVPIPANTSGWYYIYGNNSSSDAHTSVTVSNPTINSITRSGGAPAILGSGAWNSGWTVTPGTTTVGTTTSSWCSNSGSNYGPNVTACNVTHSGLGFLSANAVPTKSATGSCTNEQSSTPPVLNGSINGFTITAGSLQTTTFNTSCGGQPTTLCNSGTCSWTFPNTQSSTSFATISDSEIGDNPFTAGCNFTSSPANFCHSGWSHAVSVTAQPCP